MPRFQVRPSEVEAIRFDGTPASALEVVSWARSVAPDLAVRERIEYGGWDDLDGHIELEIQGQDGQAVDGDWIVCADWNGQQVIHIVNDDAFRRHFQSAAV